MSISEMGQKAEVLKTGPECPLLGEKLPFYVCFPRVLKAAAGMSEAGRIADSRSFGVSRLHERSDDLDAGVSNRSRKLAAKSAPGWGNHGAWGVLLLWYA